MSGLAKYHAESAIIGRLLTGYTDLEIDLLHCVQQATGDFDTAFRAMFRRQGETSRINTGAKLGRPAYVPLGLDTDFDAGVDAMRHCLTIRNQYAHHNFWDDYTGLAIGSLEDAAKLPGKIADFSAVKVNHIDVALLDEQERYFHFADGLLAWVNFEGRFKRGLLNSNPVTKPSPRAKPALHIQ